MKTRPCFQRFAFAIVVLLSMPFATKADEAPPNIIYILADDLGYAELGCYGQQKIKTPQHRPIGRRRHAVHAALLRQRRLCSVAMCADDRQTSRARLHPQQPQRLTTCPPRSKTNTAWSFRASSRFPTTEVTIAEMLKQKGLCNGGRLASGAWGTSVQRGDPTSRASTCSSVTTARHMPTATIPAHLWRNDQKVKLDNDPPVPGHASLPATAPTQRPDVIRSRSRARTTPRPDDRRGVGVHAREQGRTVLPVLSLHRSRMWRCTFLTKN